MRNWAGNLEYHARRLHEPTSVEELQEIVRRSSTLRMLGSRHSFNDIADTTGDLVSMARMPRVIEIDANARTVTVDGGIRYGELCQQLHEAGYAIHNLASLPHISVAGACATGTHGSGDQSGGLATAVVSMGVIQANGAIARFDRLTDPDVMNGVVVSLGALGAVTELKLDIEPAYLVRQDVYEDLPLAELGKHFDELTSSADSVSFFTEWRGPTVDQVWLKRRVPDDGAVEASANLFGARRAMEDRHPIRGIPAASCTPQMGVAGPWHERLPHFRMDHTPSSGDELQTEYFVPRHLAIDAFLALQPLREQIARLIQVSELRTIAADDLWLSMAAGRPSAAIHFTWKPDGEAVRQLLPEIEAALQPFEPRPHWGKVFTMPADEVRAGYPRLPDFVALARRHDPDGKFRNAFLERLVFGSR